MKNIPISKEDERKLVPCKDTLIELAEANNPFKSKKKLQVLVKEGGDLTQEMLSPVKSGLVFLMLERQWCILKFTICILL